MDKPHKNLKAWQLAMDIAEKIYSTTESFPSDEKFGLVSQMRRSAISIPSNIAEGAGRHTKKEFMNFLHIAQGSLSELDTQLELSLRL
jgi:four helix bundle protein